MRKIGLVLAALFFSTPVLAAGTSADVQVQVQSAMQLYIDQISIGGSYTYVDAKSRKYRTLYPANAHPFVVTIGEDYFVCSEMVDGAGTTLTADFLVREIDKQYRVVQMIVDDRPLVEAAISNAKK